MKSHAFLAIVAVLVSLTQATSAAAQQNAHQLRAGAAAVDITPVEFPVNMPGGFNENLADKASDKLHARALVLDDGKTTIALVLVDNLGLAREVTDEVKLLASRKCKIFPENILISATHTHSAPPNNVTDGRPGEVAYRKLLIKGTVDAIAQAYAELRPAAVAHSVAPLAEEVFNRRWYLKPGKMPVNPFGRYDTVKMNPSNSPDVLLRPAGPTDPDITILNVQDAKTKKPLALYANYSLHYVGGTPAKAVSSDYFGEFARLMPSRLRAGDGFVAMISNGTSGDINNIPFNTVRPPREPLEQIRIVAGKAADTVWHAHQKIKSHEDATIDMLQREVTLRVRKPNDEHLGWAKKVLEAKDDERAKLPPLAESYARRTMTLSKSNESLKALLQVVRVGDLAICAIPFEVFVEIGLELKKKSPFSRTLVVGLANGYNGYLPTPEHHKLGGYETWLGTNRVQEDTSVILTKELLEMLGKLHKAK